MYVHQRAGIVMKNYLKKMKSYLMMKVRHQPVACLRRCRCGHLCLDVWILNLVVLLGLHVPSHAPSHAIWPPPSLLC